MEIRINDKEVRDRIIRAISSSNFRWRTPRGRAKDSGIHVMRQRQQCMRYMTMKKLSVFASSIIFSAIAYAAPDELEIIGLVPGVSTQAEVEQAKAEYGYLIGGYELVCIPEYINGLLSNFLCVTGEKSGSRDRTTESARFASNTEVHTDLVKGFTRKFGAPTEIDDSTVKSMFGTEFNSNSVTWIDKKGNRLFLSSILGKVDQGVLMLQSAQQVMKDKAEEQAADKKRAY
jgi:hypothetical protein